MWDMSEADSGPVPASPPLEAAEVKMVLQCSLCPRTYVLTSLFGFSGACFS